MSKRITEITRRDLWEVLEGFGWWGRLSEVQFLARLYPLGTLESGDPRFKNAEGDIIQHRVANNDWPDDWIFSDDRFGLADGDDEILLRFLCGMFHPTVRRGDFSELLASINGLLGADGYEIVESGSVSGRPTYGWESIEPTAFRGDAHFRKDVRPLIATASELARLDGSDLEREVLSTAHPKLEEVEYDNWNGGSSYYTLTLTVPVALFARLGDKVGTVEKAISKRLEQVHRATDGHRITAVVIQPGQVRSNTRELSRVIAQRLDQKIPQFWTPGQFRLFLSHITGFKQSTAALRNSLSKYHISAFVAHDTIEDGELWQREIEAALRSMDAMAAILTPGFPESKWTDQEIGWALGRGVYVLPIRRGLEPYGFIAEVQGIQGLGKMVNAVAERVFMALAKHSMTATRLREALIDGCLKSASAAEASANVALIERVGKLPAGLARDLDVSAPKNLHLAGPAISRRIKAAAGAFGSPA